MISSGESSTSIFNTLPRPEPPPAIQSSPHLTEGMPSLEYQRTRPFRGLRIDTSGSNSPASSKTVSPTHEYAKLARANSLKRRQSATEARKYLSRYRLGESYDVKGLDDDIRGTATPPIDVPTPPASGPGEHLEDDSLSVDNAVGLRSTSITFSPMDTLDSGKKVPANASLPKAGRTRGRSMIDELESSMSGQPSVRSHSESERTLYDPVTGERRPSHGNIPDDHRQYHAGERRRLLLRSTMDELATGGSSMHDRARLPISDAVDYMLSPVSASSPYQPTSLEDTSAWPLSRRSISGRKLQPRRQRSRGVSRQSSASKSPASEYLYGSLGSTAAADPDDEGQMVGTYVLGKQISYGGFSIIREAYNTEHDEKLVRAVKIVRKQVPEKGEQDNEKLQIELEREVDIWRSLRHEHILPLISVYVSSFATFCFTELYSSGTLYNLIRAKRQSGIMGLPGNVALRYAYQLGSAIRYLHRDMHVVHRDIKLENCLLDMSAPDAETAGGRILLCDFGMAEYISDDADHGRQQIRASESEMFDGATDRVHHRKLGPSDTSTSIVGSLQYASPETINAPTGLFNPAVDIWTFGVVVYTLFVGELPFHDTFQPRLVVSIIKGEWNEDLLRQAHGIASMEEDAIELIRGCLEMDPDIRWDITQVMACDWFEGYESQGAMSGGGW